MSTADGTMQVSIINREVLQKEEQLATLLRGRATRLQHFLGVGMLLLTLYLLPLL